MRRIFTRSALIFRTRIFHVGNHQIVGTSKPRARFRFTSFRSFRYNFAIAVRDLHAHPINGLLRRAILLCVRMRRVRLHFSPSPLFCIIDGYPPCVCVRVVCMCVRVCVDRVAFLSRLLGTPGRGIDFVVPRNRRYAS